MNVRIILYRYVLCGYCVCNNDFINPLIHAHHKKLLECVIGASLSKPYLMISMVHAQN